MLVEKLQTICTSATFPDDLPRMLAQLKCHEPIMIRSKNVSLQKVYNSILYRPEIEKKRDILLELIESVKFQQCFVFASSHSFAQSASLFLNSKGWANTMLSGSLDQRDRTQAWEQLVDKETTILVATDLACRGLDSHHADLIIHVDPSKDNANMSHRVGRSGRFGGHGESIQIAVNDEDLEKYKDFAKFMNYDEVIHRDQAKLVKIVNKRLESENKIKEQEKEHFKEEEIVETTTIEVAKSPEIHSQELIDAGASADLIKNVRKEKLSELEEEKYVPTIEESTPHNESIAESLSSPKPGPIRKPSGTSKKLDFENPPNKRSQTIRIPPIWETLGVPRPGKHLENTVVADTEVFLDSIDKMNDEEFSEWRRTVKPRSEKIFDERRVEISASESEFSSSSEEDEDDVKNQKIPGMVENRNYL
jgi:superfamily II DNA/RNA helicase